MTQTAFRRRSLWKLLLWGGCTMLGLAVLAQLVLGIAEIGHIDASSTQALQRAEDAGRATVDALKRAEASPFDACSDADLGLLRHIAYANSFVADMGRVDQGVVLCTALWGRLDSHSRLPVPHYQYRDYLVWSQQDILKTHYLSNMVAFGHSLAIASPTTFELNRFYQDVALRITNRDQSYVYAERESLRYNPAGAIRLLPEFRVLQCSKDMSLCAQASARLHWLPLAYPGAFLGVLAAGLLAGTLACLLFLRHRRNQGVVEKLRNAILDGEIVLLYQPIVGVTDLTLKGYEALARWRPDHSSEIGPEVFVPLALQHGLSSALTKAVLERAIGEMGATLQGNGALMLAINTEVADIEDPDFIAFAMGITADIPELRWQLHLEVTERADIRSPVFTQHVELLKQAGFALWIDDFGTGSANLSHLSYAQFDGIKIDRLFTSALSTVSPLRSIVPNLLRLAHELELQVVIEGIETESQLQSVREIASEIHAQGWLFSKPLELGEIIPRPALA